eukprot:TRINITY_DN455_c0_g3_i1.p1 TRINITY_DN455_c0_g3~~TRINITY_DN455_c0_g3_i1.p1  ORF type:complete len:497 (-),score=108.77 TRINITY_DN455_c0_g3_i1:219-1709(-)
MFPQLQHAAIPQNPAVPRDPLTELKVLFDRIDIEKNGSLNFQEFYYFIQMSNPTISQSYAEYMYGQIDTNRSGKIVWSEFLEAAKNPQIGLLYILKGGSIPPSDQQAAVRRSIAHPPSPPHTQNPQQPPRPTSAHPSQNQNMRRLTAKEMRAALQLYEKLDVDHDDNVSISEFKSALKSVDPAYPDADIERLFRLIDTDRTGTISVDEFLQGISSGYMNPTLFAKLSGQTSGFDWEISFNELHLGAKLGEGSFGEVFTGTWRGAKVAIKTLKDIHTDLRVQKDFQDEVNLLSKLRHPNCVLFLGASMNPPNFTMVTEFCGKGTLDGVLKKRQLTSETYIKVLSGIALGLNYLHLRQPRIIHRDLKPENVLLDDNMTAKLADFGLSTIRSASASIQGVCGTPAYMAPEIWMNKPYDEKVDVYSYSIVLFECTFYQLPLNYNTIEEFSRASISGIRPAVPKELHPVISNIITRGWAVNPTDRPTMEEIIKELGKLMRA